MRHHRHHLEAPQQAARVFMSTEVKKITTLIAEFRRSTLAIDRELRRSKIASDPSLARSLDARRNNLILTIGVLDNRLSALRGLLELGRPHATPWLH